MLPRMRVIEQISEHRLLRDHEVAELLRVSLSTLERWRRTGEGPKFIRLSRSGIRYKLIDINEWLTTRRAGGAP